LTPGNPFCAAVDLRPISMDARVKPAHDEAKSVSTLNEICSSRYQHGREVKGVVCRPLVRPTPVGPAIEVEKISARRVLH